jgi:hypothetical protein
MRREISNETVQNIISRIYRDAVVASSNKKFIKLVYKASDFNSLIDEKSFHDVIGFLPNTTFRGSPLIIGVMYKISDANYEVIVQNPKHD